MKIGKKPSGIGDFDGDPLELLKRIYQSGGASLRLRAECAQFLINYKEKYSVTFNGTPIEFLRQAYKNKSLPMKDRIDCARYIADQEMKEKQLELPFPEQQTTVILKTVNNETASKTGITDDKTR